MTIDFNTFVLLVVQNSKTIPIDEGGGLTERSGLLVLNDNVCGWHVIQLLYDAWGFQN